MDNNIDAASVMNWVPEMWRDEVVAALKDHLTIVQQYSHGRKCQWYEDWHTAEIDGESFKRDDVKIVSYRDDGVQVREFHGSKVVTRHVPDVAAQDDLEALFAKWRAEGKGALEDTVMFDEDGCGCCSSGESVFARLTTEVTETVERRARVEDCTFYAARRGTISFAKHDYSAIEAVKRVLSPENFEGLARGGYTFGKPKGAEPES